MASRITNTLLAIVAILLGIDLAVRLRRQPPPEPVVIDHTDDFLTVFDRMTSFIAPRDVPTDQAATPPLPEPTPESPEGIWLDPTDTLWQEPDPSATGQVVPIGYRPFADVDPTPLPGERP